VPRHAPVVAFGTAPRSRPARRAAVYIPPPVPPLRLLAALPALVVVALAATQGALQGALDAGPDASAALEGTRGVWAYLALAVGPIATEELAPILAGIEIGRGELPLVPALVVMAIGGWVATTLIYALGRWRGRWVRRRFPRADRTIKRLLRATRRRPWRAAFLVRWAFGLRILLPLACGAAHVRPDVYLVGSAISSVTWTLGYTFVGFWFGQAAVALLQRVREYDGVATAVVAVLAVGAWLVVRRRRQHAAARTAARAAGPASATVPPLPEPPTSAP
jgi:membrane protein DedA with SNARE-associated domain